jgi:hypothetical protein
VTVTDAATDTMHAARVGSYAEPDVVGAETYGRRGQHDSRDYEEDDSSHRACANCEGNKDCHRGDDEGAKGAIQHAHVADHRVPPFY